MELSANWCLSEIIRQISGEGSYLWRKLKAASKKNQLFPFQMARLDARSALIAVFKALERRFTTSPQCGVNKSMSSASMFQDISSGLKELLVFGLQSLENLHCISNITERLLLFEQLTRVNRLWNFGLKESPPWPSLAISASWYLHCGNIHEFFFGQCLNSNTRYKDRPWRKSHISKMIHTIPNENKMISR